MRPHTAFAVHEVSQVGAARRFAAALAQELGFDEVAAGRLAIVVTELGNNLVRHAGGGGGRLLIGALAQRQATHVEVISVDGGPGMHDTERCLRDGFSTAGTPGSGLGAVRRLSQGFEIFSAPARGTVVVSRVAPRADAKAGIGVAADERIEFAGICLAAPGETVSGDGWSCRVDQGGGALIVADGLGHGPEAATAADAAIDCFERHAGLPPDALLDRAHAALRGTRGAAVAVLNFDATSGALSICGAGNIAGRLLSGTEDRSMMMQHGTVGLQIRRSQAMAYTWQEHTVIVVHSDGIVGRWTLADVPALLQCSAIVIAAWVLHHHLRGRDDATVVALRRRR